VAGPRGRTFQVLDPATEEPIGDVAEAGAGRRRPRRRRRRAALESGEWGPARRRRARPPAEPRRADLLAENAEAFAAVESLDIGKPGFEPRFIDLPQAIQTFRQDFAGLGGQDPGPVDPHAPDTWGGRCSTTPSANRSAWWRRSQPWNSPTMIGALEARPGSRGRLLRWCCKPPEDAPLTSLMLVRLMHEAGSAGRR
jgi:betaine-aldehyde dehydrogenase